MQAFDLTCLSNADIKNRKSSIIKKAIGISALCILSTIINHHFSNSFLAVTSFGFAFLAIINAFYDYLYHLPVKSAQEEQEILTMIQNFPELESYHKQVLAQNRAFITWEAEMMRHWCYHKNQEKVSQVLYPK